MVMVDHASQTAQLDNEEKPASFSTVVSDLRTQRLIWHISDRIEEVKPSVGDTKPDCAPCNTLSFISGPS